MENSKNISSKSTLENNTTFKIIAGLFMLLALVYGVGYFIGYFS